MLSRTFQRFAEAERCIIFKPIVDNRCSQLFEMETKEALNCYMQIIVMERFAQVSLNTMNEKPKPSCRGKRKYFHQETTKEKRQTCLTKNSWISYFAFILCIKKGPGIDDV